MIQAPEDTTQSLFATPETLKTQAINSAVYWYDSSNRMHARGEKSEAPLFHRSDEKLINYMDMSDIFRTQPMWQVFHFKERGRPAYIAPVNRYPQQAGFFFGSVLMNDLTHGMYNSQHIPLNFIRNIESSIAVGQMQNLGMGSAASIYVTPDSRHTKASWTRIVYKQGNFGYSDLDISFVQPVSESFAVQLGGINSLYDGSIQGGNAQHQNYRGEVTWQYNPQFYVRGQFFLNRVRAGMTALDFPQEIAFPRHVELRDDYFIDATWIQNDSTGQRVHAVLFNNYVSRRFRDSGSPYRVYTKQKKWGADVNYNLFLGKNEILVGAGAIVPRINGVAYKKSHYPTAANAYLQLRIPFLSQIELTTRAQLDLHRLFNPQLSTSLIADVKPAENHELKLSAGRSVRFPVVNELFFSFDSLFGNSLLTPEEHISFAGEYRIDNGWWSVEMKGQYTRINNEIIWDSTRFVNRFETRDFAAFGIAANIQLWKFRLAAGGHYLFADEYLTPRSSAHIQLRFNDVWLKGALKVDAVAGIYYYDRHTAINYEPRLERFYPGKDITTAYSIFNWKIVGTVQTARIFFEMDNQFAEEYEIINGYGELFQRWRFGVNWVLWD